MSRNSESLVCLVVLLAGCSSADIATPDGGPGADGSVQDASSRDGASGVDSGGSTDGGGRDSGGRDGGPADGGVVDSGAVADAGPGRRPGAGDLVITEIMAASDVVIDDCGEWFEVTNPSATVTYALDGCFLHDPGNVAIVTGAVLLAPGEILSLARYNAAFCEPMGFTGTGFTPDYSYGPTLKFSNDGDEVWITCDGTEVDRVNFTTWPISNGASFNLDPDSIDATSNDDMSSWCFGTSVYNSGAGEVDRGTPGRANTDC